MESSKHAFENLLKDLPYGPACASYYILCVLNETCRTYL